MHSTAAHNVDITIALLVRRSWASLAIQVSLKLLQAAHIILTACTYSGGWRALLSYLHPPALLLFILHHILLVRSFRRLLILHSLIPARHVQGHHPRRGLHAHRPAMRRHQPFCSCTARKEAHARAEAYDAQQLRPPPSVGAPHGGRGRFPQHALVNADAFRALVPIQL